ncbi:type II secretory pathway pseudopilin PulG [Sphingomonas vulcanisoli]|uniref:Type II secretory pathway pseudopilin PulG n=1 Tax=Sphingomonas vulcanisoli TaxID=1658060 RepID=A0ABX0TT61_9SPHN|nr:hypothetical protein [Sphingomonas vulcanisoli]NIJ08707.1 type II secretory pathway pseudopilin PulG [Sphingomonas vulcanisoli]
MGELLEIVSGPVAAADPSHEPEREDQSVEIHKPKAAHTLREFLIEIGTIICGILIALALEQAVEWTHGQERLHQVQEQLHAEISANVQSASLWLALAPCLDQQLFDIETGLLAARESGRYAGANRFSPKLIRFQSEAWLNARAMQIFDRLPAADAKALGSFYFFPIEMQSSMVTLHSQAGELELLSRPLEHLTPAETDDLLAKLGRAKELYARMNYASLLLIGSGRELNARPPNEYSRTQLLSGLKPSDRRCVLEPMRVWGIVNAARDEAEVWSALRLHYNTQ